MQRSRSFTSIAFEQKRKTPTRQNSPTRQSSRPKPEWNDYLTDPNRFKVSQDDILKKKRSLVSKNNILAAEYQPPKIKSALSTPRKQVSSPTKRASTPAQNPHREESAPMVRKFSQERFSSLDLLRSSHSVEDEDDEAHSIDNDSDENSAFADSRHPRDDISTAELDSDEENRGRDVYLMKPKHRHSHNTSQKSPPSTDEQTRPRSTWGTSSRSSLVVTSPSSPTPVGGKKASKSVKAVSAGGSVSSVQAHQQAATQPHHTAKFIEKSDRIEDEDLLDIAQNIDHLQQELRMYEEVAGKKSILDAEELQLILGVDEYGTMNMDSLNQKTVIRYLVSLVCQTMTYTLQSEVKQHHLESELQLMQSKIDEVLRVVQQQQHTNASYSRYVLSAPVLPTTMPTPQSPPMNAATTLATSASPPYIASPPAHEPTSPLATTPAASSSTATNTTPSQKFYGTSTSDWLFMRANNSASQKIVADHESPTVQTASKSLEEQVLRTPVPAYEYQLAPETAADLASRTYDLYLKQQEKQQYSSSDKDGEPGSSLADLDHYDEMIERLSYNFSASTKSASKYAGGEGVSIVVPNMDVPMPAKPSPHPFKSPSMTVSVVSSSAGGQNLFPASPLTAKKIYDASLGNYSLVDTYDD